MSTQQPAPIPVYVMHEYNSFDDAESFYGVYASLEAAQAKAAEDDRASDITWQPHSPAITWLTGSPPEGFTATEWTAVTDGGSWRISRHQLPCSSDGAYRAAVLLMAAEILRAEFGPITVENELKVLRSVARQLAPDPEGDKAQEDRSWEG